MSFLKGLVFEGPRLLLWLYNMFASFGHCWRLAITHKPHCRVIIRIIGYCLRSLLLMRVDLPMFLLYVWVHGLNLCAVWLRTLATPIYIFPFFQMTRATSLKSFTQQSRMCPLTLLFTSLHWGNDGAQAWFLEDMCAWCDDHDLASRRCVGRWKLRVITTLRKAGGPADYQNTTLSFGKQFTSASFVGRLHAPT